MRKRYKSDMMAAIHETAEDHLAAGIMPIRSLRLLSYLSYNRG